MTTLYRYDENGLYLGEIETVINPMFNFPDEPIDKGYYDEDGNPPIPPDVGVDERAVWIGYRYSIEPKYIQFENTYIGSSWWHIQLTYSHKYAYI